MKAENTSDSELFIPIKPDKKRRFKIMMASSVPAFVLIAASFSASSGSVGSLSLKYFNIIVGLLILGVNFISYRSPERKRIFGTDMALVLSGLLLLAQGASDFDPVKGFQPSHLLFLAGSFSIFKGVMFPEAKVRRGFIISDATITFRRNPFSKVIRINRSELSDISMENDTLNFVISGDQKIKIRLEGYENSNLIYNDLKELIRD